MYNSTNDLKYIYSELSKHPMLWRVEETSIPKRMIEIRNLFDLKPKMPENTYSNKYDRIRGYIIRNSKYMAGRRGIYFNLKYTDFELPKYCNSLGFVGFLIIL